VNPATSDVADLPHAQLTDRKVIIWGAAGQALVVEDILRLHGNRDVIGFLDDVDSSRAGEPFGGGTILGGAEQLPRLRAEGVTSVILAFGDCESRIALADRLRADGFLIEGAIHPSSVIAPDSTIGEGTIVAAGVVVNPQASIGRNVILNTSATVDHHCVVEDGAHIAPGVHLAGWVTIRRAAWVGIGATVTDRVTIGARAVIGAGAVVVRDIPDDVVAYGVPARVVRSTKEPSNGN
jgi:UDP-N-acetylbacillosamine N-acetyltransferase